MLPREIVRQVRRLQLRARRAVEDLLGGEYHSVFRGAGLAFEEVRAYQPGDDVRGIDWNVTARMGQPFVKRYIEERERTVVLAMDVSASLAFSATSNNDRVGLVQFSDRIEHYLPPRKGARHVLRLIRDVLFFEPAHKGTSLRLGLDHLNRVLHRKAIVFLFSDFLDLDHAKSFRRTARRHELIAVRLLDPREQELPDVGLVELEDAETGEHRLIDTSSAALREAYLEQGRRQTQAVRELARSSGVDLIEASTDGGHLDELVRFFRMRQKRMRRG
jgi:uncharacterized protein (DUF58 family)